MIPCSFKSLGEMMMMIVNNVLMNLSIIQNTILEIRKSQGAMHFVESSLWNVVHGRVWTNVGPNIGECMVSIINVNNGIKEPICGYQTCNTNQTIDIWWACQGEGILYTWLITWVNTILNHIDTRVILPTHEVLAMYIDLNGVETNILSNTHTHIHTCEKNMKSSV